MTAGIALVIVGIVFAFNFRRSAERLAESARPVPWWMKWPLTDDPAGYRAMGGVFALLGVLFVVAGPH